MVSRAIELTRDSVLLLAEGAINLALVGVQIALSLRRVVFVFVLHRRLLRGTYMWKHGQSRMGAARYHSATGALFGNVVVGRRGA